MKDFRDTIAAGNASDEFAESLGDFVFIDLTPYIFSKACLRNEAL
jgi:hypothetical protein